MAQKKSGPGRERAAAPRRLRPSRHRVDPRADRRRRRAAACTDQRARASSPQQVGISKHAAGHMVDFYRPEREAAGAAHGARAQPQGRGPLRDEEILRLFREIMSACLAQEEPLKVAYLGPEGTFTQPAVLKHFGHSVRALPLTSIEEVFHEVRGGQCRLRRGAGRELHRRHGQQHARQVPDLAARHLRRSGAARPSQPDGRA